jgi:hypothetical protein
MIEHSLLNWIRAVTIAALAVVPGLSCSYSISVPAIPASGGLVYASVETQRGCPWTIETGGFLGIYSPRTGAGPGTAVLVAEPDRGAPRSTRVSLLNPGHGIVVADSQTGSLSGAGSFGEVVAWTTAIQY